MHRILSGGVNCLGEIILVSARVFPEIVFQTDLSTTLERPCIHKFRAAIYISVTFLAGMYLFLRSELGFEQHSEAYSEWVFVNRLFKDHSPVERDGVSIKSHSAFH